jgi:hypothetical protein
MAGGGGRGRGLFFVKSFPSFKGSWKVPGLSLNVATENISRNFLRVSQIFWMIGTALEVFGDTERPVMMVGMREKQIHGPQVDQNARKLCMMFLLSVRDFTSVVREILYYSFNLLQKICLYLVSDL